MIVYKAQSKEPKVRRRHIHLSDAIKIDGDVSNLGKLTILPARYTDSLRHMHEYVLEAITYAWKYGYQELFITFTYNPACIEISDFSSGISEFIRCFQITATHFKLEIEILVILLRNINQPKLCNGTWIHS